MSINIGVAGGIGAGKSGFLRRLKCEYPDSNVFSVDDEVKTLYTDPIWREYLVETYGTCDKRKISAMAFDDPAMLKDIMEQSVDWIDSAIKSWMKMPGINIIEFPLMFEYERENLFTVAVLIVAPKETRIERVMKRDSKTREEVIRIMAMQLDDEVKVLRADIIIDTTFKEQGSSDYDNALACIQYAIIQKARRPLCVMV